MLESIPSQAELPAHSELWQQTLGWQPTPQQQQQFQCLYLTILRANQFLNLTRITDPQEFWEKHLWDSLSGISPYLAATQINQGWSVIDIGTGAGFPGLAVAIARPDWQITLLDGTRKKINFLESLVLELALPNVHLICDRAEHLKRQPRSFRDFDLALIRAVGKASLCAAYALPLLKATGTAILYRGQWSDSDTQSLERELQKQQGSLELVQPWVTPLSQSDRHCLYLRKQHLHSGPSTVKSNQIEFS